jgi:uncharacterized protein
MAESSSPISLSERITTLDVVRGFALLGIFIMNMPGFSTSFSSGADGSDIWTARYDLVAEAARDMLFSGKFNSMFSMLFGIGFTIQLGRLMVRSPDQAVPIYLRRLFLLMAFGLIHAFIFWPGDVLHIYAVLGLGLLLIRNVSNRTIVILIVLSFLYPLVNGVIRLNVITPDMVVDFVKADQAQEAADKIAYGQGNFLDAVAANTRSMLYAYTDVNQLSRFSNFWAAMSCTLLIGFLIGRNDWVRQVPERMPTIRRLHWWALGVGLVCAATFGTIGQLYRVPGPSVIKLVGSMAYVLCRLAMVMFYVLTIVRLSQQAVWQQRFAPMATVGRMPLSNYLMQTLIATAIFNGWGLGLYYKVGPALGLALSFGIFFLVQVPLSKWWLRSHAFGPMEWLWRYATYGRRPEGAAAAQAA